MNQDSMPVQSCWSHKRHERIEGQQIPWAMLEPHNAQAMRNHAGQDLVVLRRRGGLSACEALAILDDRPYRLMDADDSTQELAQRVAAYQRLLEGGR